MAIHTCNLLRDYDAFASLFYRVNRNRNCKNGCTYQFLNLDLISITIINRRCESTIIPEASSSHKHEAVNWQQTTTYFHHGHSRIYIFSFRIGNNDKCCCYMIVVCCFCGYRCCYYCYVLFYGYAITMVTYCCHGYVLFHVS